MGIEDHTFALLTLLGPTLVGILTVPVLQGIKRLSGWVDATPPWVKQILVVVIAYGLNQLGALADVALPESLTLFDGSTVEALLSAAMAYGIHAGKTAVGYEEVERIAEEKAEA